MAYNFNGTNQYLETSFSQLDTPLTMCCNCRLESTFTGNRSVLSLGSINASQRHSVALNSGDGTVYVPIAFSQGTVTSTFSGGGVGHLIGNTTRHICGVFNSSSLRNVYYQGSLTGGTSVTEVGTTTTNTVTIGARWLTTVGIYWPGDISEVGIWNVALTAAEIASLAKGMACDKVRPQSLVFYAPLARDLIDVRGGRTITNNNTATVANHPRIYQ